MALSPSHRFGQAIGRVLEDSIFPLLKQFSERNGLYLDTQGHRPARSTKKVTWTDSDGNSHDLDFVLERGGTPVRIGQPVAFIELAWRRYTKHSRNKAQEIQGALVPLSNRYSSCGPLKATILAGEFTHGAIQQLESLGFAVLYFDYASIISAFSVVGIDASYDEATSDLDFLRKLKALERIGLAKRGMISRRLLEMNKTKVEVFMKRLEGVVRRRVELVRILPLYGSAHTCDNVNEAIRFISTHGSPADKPVFQRFEVEIRYLNRDCIRGEFTSKKNAIDFLALHT